MVKQPETPKTESQINGIAATLSQCPLLSSLSTEQLLRIAAVSRIETFQKGAVIAREDGKVTGVYVVQSGHVELSTQARTENQYVSHVINAGECFGIMSVIPGEHAMVSSMAVGQVKLIYIPRESFMQLYASAPELPLKVSATLCDYIRYMKECVHRLKAPSIEARLADWLLGQPVESATDESANSLGTLVSGADVITMPTTKVVLARELGVTPQSLSRAFANFRKQGLIRMGKTQIYILDRAGIEAWAEKTQSAKTKMYA